MQIQDSLIISQVSTFNCSSFTLIYLTQEPSYCSFLFSQKMMSQMKGILLFINCMFHVQRVLNELQVCLSSCNVCWLQIPVIFQNEMPCPMWQCYLIGRIYHCSNCKAHLSTCGLMWHLLNDLLLYVYCGDKLKFPFVVSLSMDFTYPKLASYALCHYILL